MKINSNASAKIKAYLRFYACPWAFSTLLTFFMAPISEAFAISMFWIPCLATLIWMPFLIVDYRRAVRSGRQEKLRLQAKHDAQDKTMFGGPLRDFEN